ncbi:hypothetical protein ACW5XX_05520, partial [Aeromonas mytilicola]
MAKAKVPSAAVRPTLHLTRGKPRSGRIVGVAFLLVTFLWPLSRPEYGLHLSPTKMENPMGQGVKRTQRDYSLTFKLALVEQIEKGELTCQQAQARYGIQGNSTVLVW